MNILETLKREWTYAAGLRKILTRIGDRTSGTKRSIADDFEASVDQYSKNVALRYEGRLFTYEELDARCNQYADWALKQGLIAGDCVALMMKNRPDYIAFWLGMLKLGISVALINYNLRGAGLAHCINISGAKSLVLGAEQADAFESAKNALEEGLDVWSIGGAIKGTQALDSLFADLSTIRPSSEHRCDVTIDDVALLIFTSGTTGLPKAAKLTHARALGMMLSFGPACNISPRDRIYSTLPLYHATAGVCGVGQALLFGASLIIKEKFSAQSFWTDAAAEGATSFIYIGELCRYLVNAPETEADRQHRIQKGFGNGLRPEVWDRFVERFNIPKLVEFYGSTEGNISLINLDGKVGAIGRLPRYLEKRLQYKIVKFDIETEAPIRDADGFCIETDLDEAGEAIGLINEQQRYDGYMDRQKSEAKVLRDVFEPGDMWFRSGDLLKKDQHDYIYFVDRIGDTFRWKGENVSTHEVAEVIETYDDIELPNVYGVKVPNTDGRAGMAAVTLSSSNALDGKALAEHIDKALPIYARPLFLRIQSSAETTGTLKFRKVDLVEAGFNPDLIDDPLYIRLPDSDAYSELTTEIFDRVHAGEIKF